MRCQARSLLMLFIAGMAAGTLWAQPVPLELLLRTQVDLEAGQVEVRDMASGTVSRRAPR